MKKVLLFLTLIASLALAACAAPAQPQSAPAQANPNLSPSVISVNGSGQVTLSPDIAYVYIGVQSMNENVSAALSENNEKAQSISRALAEMGIDPNDIQTSSFNIYPQQQYGPTGEMTGTTYNVNNTVYITVRDLQILGSLLDVVVRAGANSINGINFDVENKDAALSEARRLAVESARKQAEEMAAAAGVGLGGLHSMSVYSSSVPMPLYEAKGGFASDASQVPVSAGQLVIRVEVGASYYIQ